MVKCYIWVIQNYTSEILEVSKFKQDVLMLVVPSTNYNQMVQITIRNLHTDMILELATKEELETLSKQWRKGFSE